MNPFIVLANTSLTKDIDQNFVETLQALIFFNEHDIVNKVNEKFPIEIKSKVDSKTISSNWFKEKINNKSICYMNSHKQVEDEDEYDGESYYSLPGTSTLGQLLKQKLSQNNSGWNAQQSTSSWGNIQKYTNSSHDEEIYSIKENLHLGEFLIDKLAQNLRRLYSANKNGGKLPKEVGSTKEDLLKQQQYIYESLEIISPYIKFDQTPRVFTNLFFGKTRYCSNANAFFYLALHEYLSSENEQKHLTLFNKILNPEDVNSSIAKDLLHLKYPKQKNSFIDSLLNIMPNEFFKEFSLYIAGNTYANGNFMFDSFMHCARNNVPLTDSEKLLLLNSILHSSGHLSKMDSRNALPVSKIIKSYLKDADINDEYFKTINVEDVHKNCATDVALYLTEKILDPRLIERIITAKLEPNQESTLLSKIDFSNQDLLFQVASRLNSYTKKLEHFQKFISITGNDMNNETISNILALDFKLIEVIKPLYMSRKLNKELNNDSSPPFTDPIVKKYKI